MNQELQEKFDLALQIQLDRRKALSTEQVQRIFSRKDVEQGMLECFDLIGGVPRLALWANDPKNYGEFLKLLSKLFPKEALEKSAQVINFLPSIPDSPLNRPQPDQMGAEDGELVGDDAE